jgi:hypothetical protein
VQARTDREKPKFNPRRAQEPRPIITEILLARAPATAHVTEETGICSGARDQKMGTGQITHAQAAKQPEKQRTKRRNLAGAHCSHEQKKTEPTKSKSDLGKIKASKEQHKQDPK